MIQDAPFITMTTKRREFMLELLQPTTGNLVSIGASGTLTAED